MTDQAAVYHLACHCQTHILQLTLPLEGLFSDNGVCDCSHCLKRRIVWGKAPKGSMKVMKGVGTDGVQLQEYRFGTKSFAHQFCGKCGTYLLGDQFKPDAESYMYNYMVTIQIRAIRGDHFDLWKHKLTLHHGLDRVPAYVQPRLDDLPGAAKYFEQLGDDDKSQIYVGSCHCQAVKFAVKTEPLETAEICDCACSICIGNGVLWLYPPQRNVYFYPPKTSSTPCIPAEGLLNDYTFGLRKNVHCICKTCGCQVFEARMPEDPDSGSFGLNITLLNDIGNYLSDAHGMSADGVQLPAGKGAAVLRGLERDDEGRTRMPVYRLNL